MQVSTLQETINEKARQRLIKDIREISNQLSSGKGYNLLKNVYVKCKNTAGVEKSVSVAFIAGNDGAYQEIFNANIDQYIKEETEAFVKKVEKIQDDVNYLLENVNQ